MTETHGTPCLKITVTCSNSFNLQKNWDEQIAHPFFALCASSTTSMPKSLAGVGFFQRKRSKPKPMSQAKKSKSKRKQILLFLLCSFLWMNWCWRIMNWLCRDLIAELMAHTNWIETDVPKGTIHATGNSRKHSFQFMQPRGCNWLRCFAFLLPHVLAFFYFLPCKCCSFLKAVPLQRLVVSGVIVT